MISGRKRARMRASRLFGLTLVPLLLLAGTDVEAGGTPKPPPTPRHRIERAPNRGLRCWRPHRPA
jgi:hypothetical protein